LAQFISDVPTYLSSNSHYNSSPETLLKELNVLYGKYKFMESQLVAQQRGLRLKIPDIQAALDGVRAIKQEKHEISTTFELSSSVFVECVVDPKVNRVALWLGANVMLEYSHQEAEDLLQKNLNNAKLNSDNLEKELDYLKDQITITEVNIARVHNYKVQLKQQINTNRG